MPRVGICPTLADTTQGQFLRDDGIWAEPPGGGGVPAGIICMWGGPVANVPVGWALCDGQGGRPDLRSRFIKGAAAGQDPGATGGSPTHQHTYTDVVQHTHTVTVNDPGHTHGQSIRNSGTAGTAGTQGASTANNATAGTTASGTTGITASTSNPAGSVAQGTTEAASSEPAFYALAFIVKL